MAETHAQKRRAERKQALNEYLSNKGKVDYIFDNIEKIEQLPVPSTDNENFMTEKIAYELEIHKRKVANEQRIKMLAKYLPDIKAIEHTGQDGEAIKTDSKFTIQIIKADA